MTPAPPPRSVAVIGGGFVGLCCAWHLRRRGHRVTLLDDGEPGGSAAALGLLMAHVYRRSSGRGWRLRQNSMALLEQWQGELAAVGHGVAVHRGLLLLAQDSDEWERLQNLAERGRRRGLPLETRSATELAGWQPALPEGLVGGLWSPRDGQLDPATWGAALAADGRRLGLELRQGATGRVERIEASATAGTGWTVVPAEGEHVRAEVLIVSAALGSTRLLAPLGLDLPLEPVLGQALELELPPEAPDLWPESVVWAGMNLVPRPGRRLWLGATLEPGTHACPEALADLRDLKGAAPDWLRRARTVRQWQGLRARPMGQPAPVLQEPLPGLLVVTGHYRNGILLAPACAAWAAERLEA
ncbi:MAG: FAD-dependent oxidoreductase [Synechococcaceae cyanobacterium ELA445]